MLLSICIPTYNRSNLLAQTIANIYQSIGFSGSNEVEVLVSDNASTDETPGVIKELQIKYPYLRAHRNSKNVIDENFFIAADAAKGKYIWVFGDDDLMEESAVSRVLETIKENNDLIILNYSTWNKDFSELLRPVRYPYERDLVMNRSNIVLKNFGVGPQFISAVVMDKSLFFSKRLYDYKQLHQYGNSFLYAVYSGISHNRAKTYYIADPIVKYRGFNSDVSDADIWYKFFIYGNNLFLKLLKPYNYSNAHIRNTRKNIIVYYLFRDIVARKKTNYNTLKLFMKIPLDYYSHLSFIIVALPMLLLPNNFFNFVYKLIKKK